MANNKTRSAEFAKGRTPNLHELEKQEVEAAHKHWMTPTAGLGVKDAAMTPGMAERYRVRGGGNLLEQMADNVWPDAGRDSGETDENAVKWNESLWPTPHANCHTGAGSQGRSGGLNLQTAVNEAEKELWPTPNASNAGNDVNLTCSGDGRTKPNKLGWAVAESIMWPTPTQKITSNTNDPDDLVNSKGAPWTLGEKPFDRRTGRAVTTALADAVRATTPSTLPTTARPRLCAAWVTRLMGYPDGWLDQA